MKKGKKHIPFLNIRIDHFLCVSLTLLIAFSNVNDFTFSSDFEMEKIENIADGEQENKEQEKLDKYEKDIIFDNEIEHKKLSKTKSLYARLNNSKFHAHYLKIPTPPPDRI